MRHKHTSPHLLLLHYIKLTALAYLLGFDSENEVLFIISVLRTGYTLQELQHASIYAITEILLETILN